MILSTGNHCDILVLVYFSQMLFAFHSEQVISCLLTHPSDSQRNVLALLPEICLAFWARHIETQRFDVGYFGSVEVRTIEVLVYINNLLVYTITWSSLHKWHIMFICWFDNYKIGTTQYTYQIQNYFWLYFWLCYSSYKYLYFKIT